MIESRANRQVPEELWEFTSLQTTIEDAIMAESLIGWVHQALQPKTPRTSQSASTESPAPFGTRSTSGTLSNQRLEMMQNKRSRSRENNASFTLSPSHIQRKSVGLDRNNRQQKAQPRTSIRRLQQPHPVQIGIQESKYAIAVNNQDTSLTNVRTSPNRDQPHQTNTSPR